MTNHSEDKELDELASILDDVHENLPEEPPITDKLKEKGDSPNIEDSLDGMVRRRQDTPDTRKIVLEYDADKLTPTGREFDSDIFVTRDTKPKTKLPAGVNEVRIAITYFGIGAGNFEGDEFYWKHALPNIKKLDTYLFRELSRLPTSYEKGGAIGYVKKPFFLNDPHYNGSKDAMDDAMKGFSPNIIISIEDTERIDDVSMHCDSTADNLSDFAHVLRGKCGVEGNGKLYSVAYMYVDRPFANFPERGQEPERWCVMGQFQLNSFGRMGLLMRMGSVVSQHYDPNKPGK